MEIHIILFALIGLLVAGSVVLFAKSAFDGDGSLMVAGGNFLWLWTAGGFLLMLIHLAKSFIP